MSVQNPEDSRLRAHCNLGPHLRGFYDTYVTVKLTVSHVGCKMDAG